MGTPQCNDAHYSLAIGTLDTAAAGEEYTVLFNVKPDWPYIRCCSKQPLLKSRPWRPNNHWKTGLLTLKQVPAAIQFK